ncbi:MAG: TlpA family protein disulfide reductase [Geminicoccaceae bacterium]
MSAVETAMRLKPIIGAAAALVVTALIAGGAYLATNTAQEARAPEPTSPATAASTKKGFAFSALETPRELPELRFVDGDGREMTLEAFEGRTILLNIWATWCVPCREEMPALDRLQAKLGGPDFVVVPLSIDREGLPAVKAFYEELGLEALGIYVDQSGKASRQLGAVGIPTTLLVDSEGREVGRTLGPAEWDSDEIVEFLRGFIAERPAAASQPEIPGETQFALRPEKRGAESQRHVPLAFQPLEGTI